MVLSNSNALLLKTTRAGEIGLHRGEGSGGSKCLRPSYSGQTARAVQGKPREQRCKARAPLAQVAADHPEPPERQRKSERRLDIATRQTMIEGSAHVVMLALYPSVPRALLAAGASPFSLSASSR